MLAPEFWKGRSLDQLNTEEWEALCDGCAQCCLHKLEDEDSGAIALTDLACQALQIDHCRCSLYNQRVDKIADCVEMTATNIAFMPWLPDTCAYRRIAEGRDLPDWHYLISGDKNKVHEHEISVRNFAVPEKQYDVDQWQDRVIRWVEPIEESKR